MLIRLDKHIKEYWKQSGIYANCINVEKEFLKTVIHQKFTKCNKNFKIQHQKLCRTRQDETIMKTCGVI